MQFRLVLLGADTFPAYIGVITPAAWSQQNFFADGPADGAGLQHLSDHVPGETPPGFHDFTFFP
jgi:hypothetical protein